MFSSFAGALLVAERDIIILPPDAPFLQRFQDPAKVLFTYKRGKKLCLSNFPSTSSGNKDVVTRHFGVLFFLFFAIIHLHILTLKVGDFYQKNDWIFSSN